MRTFAVAPLAALVLSIGSLVSAGQALADEEFSGFAPRAMTGSCIFTRTEFSASVFAQQTTSMTFVNLGDGGSITFNQSVAGCVAGVFFGNAGNNTSGARVIMQVQLDGNNCAPLTTNGYVFANSDTDLSSHAVGFLCGTHVPVGTHKVQVQWGAGGGGEAVIFEHTLEVNHR
jgi:hypothetical protein